jgi:iron(III) transport system substrate-binding protein
MKWKMFIGVFVLALFLAIPPLHAQSDPWEDLYKAAKTEGKVIWQLGTPVEEYKPVIDAFEKRFPEIKLNPVRAVGASMISRLITESASRNVSVDVSMVSLLFLKPLLDRDLLVKEDWKRFGNTDLRVSLLDGRFLVIQENSNVMIYNTKSVPPAKVPKTWEDLLNPEWKGQICIPQTQIGASIVFEIWDENKAVKYLEALGKQQLVIESGANMTLPRCANGEVALANTYMSQVPMWKAQGQPIDATPISPQWDSPQGAYSVKGLPHPNAAKLFMGWLITPEGQAAMVKTGKGPSSPCNASASAQLLCDKGIKLIKTDTVEKAMRQDALIERTRKILGLKPPT